jgi:hypothetical protein
MAATTDTQMALAADSKFIRRLAALFNLEAQVVIAEPINTPNHPIRRQLAQSCVTNGASVAQQFALTLALSTNLMGANTTYDFVQLAVVTDATDAAIRSQIVTLWNGLAGV